MDLKEWVSETVVKRYSFISYNLMPVVNAGFISYYLIFIAAFWGVYTSIVIEKWKFKGNIFMSHFFNSKWQARIVVTPMSML